MTDAPMPPPPVRARAAVLVFMLALAAVAVVELAGGGRMDAMDANIAVALVITAALFAGRWVVSRR